VLLLEPPPQIAPLALVPPQFIHRLEPLQQLDPQLELTQFLLLGLALLFQMAALLLLELLLVAPLQLEHQSQFALLQLVVQHQLVPPQQVVPLLEPVHFHLLVLDPQLGPPLQQRLLAQLAPPPLLVILPLFELPQLALHQ